MDRMSSSERIPDSASLQGSVSSVLLIPFEDAAATATVKATFPAASVHIVSKSDLAGRPLLTSMRSLRTKRYDVAAASMYGQTVPRTVILVRLMLQLLRARRRLLRMNDGTWTSVSAATFVTSVMPSLAIGGVVGLAVLVLSRFVVSAVRWTGMSHPNQEAVAAPDHPVRTVLFLRPDLGGNVKAGGSVSHVKGIIGAFVRKGIRVIYVSNGRLEGVPEDVEQIVVPQVRVLEFMDELQMICYNLQLLLRIVRLSRYRPDIVYQRHALHHYAGGILARLLSARFVLEVNASEVWVRESWSRLVLGGHARAAEAVILGMADTISVVSTGVMEQLRPFGIPRERFVVAPNGVDIRVFRPDIDGAAVRRKLGIGDEVTIGFIGTFTRWHGVETLRDAILADDPVLAGAHFVLIGDGDLRRAIQHDIEGSHARDRCTFTGLVDHDETPRYLAACDILVSPHLGFADGSAFFGSPTKLFEYMAMGRAIVASSLGQIAEVIRDGENGLLFPPGDVAMLTSQLGLLVQDEQLRARLGEQARTDAVSSYTWERNVEGVLRGL